MSVVLGFAAALALLLLRVPIGIALGLVGTLGLASFVGLTPALRSVGSVASDTDRKSVV